MGRIIMMQILLLFSGFGYAQNEMFSLSLRLVKPNGIVDAHSYFTVSLTNLSSDVTFIIGSPSDASRGNGIGATSWLIPEVLFKDGSLVDNGKHGFFYFVMDGKSFLKIAPKQSYSYDFPISYILKMGQLNIYKIRMKLDRFITVGFKEEDSTYWDLTLYSNWLDVSNEDFSKVLVK